MKKSQKNEKIGRIRQKIRQRIRRRIGVATDWEATEHQATD
jgi:hypothetical protein